MMVDAEKIVSRVCLPLCSRSSDIKSLYALMFAIRIFEESVLELFSKGELAGTTHTCLGQEATAVGVVPMRDCERDIVFSNHRGHGHFLAYCGEIERLYMELLGKPGGVCAGRGGSQHLHWKNYYSNGVQGGIVPVATGMAHAEKIKETDAIVIVFLGDGTLGQGVVYESFNIASLWKLPILFVIDNNGYAQSTPSSLQIAGSIQARPEAFEIPVRECKTTNVLEVKSLADELIDTVREERRPHCLLLHSYRLGAHSKGDDDRNPLEIQAAWERDPLKNGREGLEIMEAERVESDIKSLVCRARKNALEGLHYEF